VPEQDADVLEVLIGKMGKDRDVVLRKCAGVLGQAELCEPIGYFLHRRPRPAEFRPSGPAGRAILPDRSRRAKSTRTVRRRVTGGQPEEPQTEEKRPTYTSKLRKALRND
jgi:hypothetical protein